MTIILSVLTSRTPVQESEREEGGQSEQNDTETAVVSDSPVRPGASAECAVMVNKQLDCKEADSGLCHHNRVAIRLCVTETTSQ